MKDNKSDIIMHTIKAVHSVMSPSGEITPAELARQRQSHELLSKLVTVPIGVVYSKLSINDTLAAEWAVPDFTHPNDKVILYCHGGGYTCGGLNYARILAGKLALYVGMRVLFFEYRLAPESPYPAAIEDGMAAYNYLLHLGYGARNVIIAGDSAGGNLSLEIALRLREERRFLPKALVLMSPWTDMTATAPSYDEYKDIDPILTREYVVGSRNLYAGEDANYKLSQYSPLFADFSNMCPILIQVGSNEILRNDSEALYDKLIKSGCYARLTVYQGGWHVFQQLPLPKSSKALEEIRDFLLGSNL